MIDFLKERYIYCYNIPSHSAKELLVCQFRCSISECNKRFVTQPICNANVCATSGGCMLHLNCYTHGGLCMCRVITKQLMYGSSRMQHWIYPHSLSVSLIKQTTQPLASCSVYINLTRSLCVQIQCYTQSHQLDQKLVCTNPMLHAEPYINYYI